VFYYFIYLQVVMTDFNGVKTEDEFSMKRRYESKAECQMYMDVYKYDIYKKYINTNDEMYKFKYSIIKCKKALTHENT